MKNLYEIISNASHFLEQILGSQEFILLISAAAIIIKSFIFFVLFSKTLKSKKIQKPLIFLFLVIIGSVISDLAWILTSTKQLSLFNIEYKHSLFAVRISWGFYIIYYQALALFIENLSSKINKIGIRQKILITISSIPTLFFFGLAFFQFNCENPSMRPSIEMPILTFTIAYITFILMPISIFYTIRKIKTKTIPRILERQLRVFITFIVTPIWLADLIQTYPFTFLTSTITNTYTTVGISSILITYGIFHCMKKIMNMRFLNFESHVQAPNQITKFHFVDDFKNILDKFSQTTTTDELESITQDFFKNAFSIPKNRTRLYIKILNKSKEIPEEYNSRNTDELFIDNFISNYDSQTSVGSFIRKNKIIITDELEFSNFYDATEEHRKILLLMDKISADIFIPIFESESTNEANSQESTLQKTVSGYIVIEKYARINNENKNAPFYSNLERDQMIVYSNYLGNMIKLLQTRSLNQIIRQEKILKEDLFSKQQEINQYRESIEHFLKNNENNDYSRKKFGIIIYKNKKFEFENQTAQELISVKLNLQDGHPITKKLKLIATQASEYKSHQSCVITDPKNENLIALAIPNSDKNNVIIILYYPEISDILLNKQPEILKDSEKRDFLLYLETTKAGILINNFLPVYSENLTNFKIDFLKIALNKKTILINSCNQDAPQIVDILNKIGIREKLNTISLDQPCENHEILIKLFGINPILSKNQAQEKPLLELLDGSGVLFIKNIHFLDFETQKYLYEFIKYGFFKVFKGEKKTFANVKIICSCDINLINAVKEGKFHKELFAELDKASINFPSPKTLNSQELENLISGFTQQIVENNKLQYILELTESENKKLVSTCPESFYELKTKINQLLIKKSNNNNISNLLKKTDIKIKPELKTNYLQVNTIIDENYNLKDEQIIEAIKLGKNALKDIKIMSMLWAKFKNQNKIASLLGVNRSSINRRCKEYNLFE